MRSSIIDRSGQRIRALCHTRTSARCQDRAACGKHRTCATITKEMSTALLRRLAFALVLLGSVPSGTAKPAEPKPFKPSCSLSCPDGFRLVLYTWELHPERTIYDENGQEMVSQDGVWKVSCSVRCEQKSESGQVQLHNDKRLLCDSGQEPAPYVGPWRITSKWVKECAALFPDACGMTCYPVRKPPPPKKQSGGKRSKKK